jgi:hypothetical protein
VRYVSVKHLENERLLSDIRSFLEAGGDAPSDAARICELRELVGRLVGASFTRSEGEAQVVAEIYDARREKVETIRVPHLHQIRNPHAPGGTSLAEAMESLELVAITASQAVRSIASEIAHQESDREKRARHVALCDPVRRWGELLMDQHPNTGKMLIDYAMNRVMPSVIDADDAVNMGLYVKDFDWLLAPDDDEELRVRLIEIAKERLREAACEK